MGGVEQTTNHHRKRGVWCNEQHMRWERKNILPGTREALRNGMVRGRRGRDGRVARWINQKRV